MKVSLISDFNLDTLGLYLRKQLGEQAEVVVGPFGQFTQTILESDLRPGSGTQLQTRVSFWMPRPETALPSVKASLEGLFPSKANSNARERRWRS